MTDNWFIGIFVSPEESHKYLSFFVETKILDSPGFLKFKVPEESAGTLNKVREHTDEVFITNYAWCLFIDNYILDCKNILTQAEDQKAKCVIDLWNEIDHFSSSKTSFWNKLLNRKKKTKYLTIPGRLVIDGKVEKVKYNHSSNFKVHKHELNRHVRVFVSSTFKDMQDERSVLAKKVFPEIRKRCQNRGIEFTEIDLRWGVTEGQVENGDVLPICFREIENSRPYFIGILGERYGWVPPKKKIPKSLSNKYPWVDKESDKSITELEILHGVLNQPKLAEHAFFYFRKYRFTELLQGNGSYKFVEKDRIARKKLTQLKRRIKNLEVSINKNYYKIETFGELVIEDIWNAILKDYPENENLPDWKIEALEHQRYAKSRSQFYIEREGYFKRLDEHFESKMTPLIIQGESGLGKTTLIANWLSHIQKLNPECLIIPYFIGITPQSTTHYSILRQIIQEIIDHFNLNNELPKNNDELVRDFPGILYNAAEKGKIIIVFDGMNQLDNNEDSQTLFWMPDYFHENVRMYLTITDAQKIKKDNWPIMDIEILSQEERKKFIQEYLLIYTKSLDETHVKPILEHSCSENPLFLKILIDELRVIGNHEQILQQIQFYLKANTISELLQMVINRIEDDFNKDYPDLVKNVLSLIYVSREGLSEQEIVEILEANGQNISQLVISSLYLSLNDFLINKQGLLNFYHDYFRKSVRHKYFSNYQYEKTFRKKIINQFSNITLNEVLSDWTINISPLEYLKCIGNGKTLNEYINIKNVNSFNRIIAELPWHFIKIKNWSGLTNLLQNMNFFIVFYYKKEYDLKEILSILEKSGNSVKKIFERVLKSPKDNVSILKDISDLLGDFGYFKESLILHTELEEIINKEFNCSSEKDFSVEMKKLITVTFITSKIYCLSKLNHFNEVNKLVEKNIIECKNIDNKYFLVRNLYVKATILGMLEKYDDALELYFEIISICEEIGDSTIQARLGMAAIQSEQGLFKDAFEMFSTGENELRKIGDITGANKCLIAQIGILESWGETDKALELLNRSENTALKYGDKHLLQQIFDTKSLVFRNFGKLNEALNFSEKSIHLCEQMKIEDKKYEVYVNKASILYDLGYRNEAIELISKSENYLKNHTSLNTLFAIKANKAIMLTGMGYFSQALLIHQEAQMFFEKMNIKGRLFESLESQVICHLKLKNLEEASNILNKIEELSSELGGKDRLISCLKFKSYLALEEKRYQEALNLQIKLEELLSNSNNLDLIDSLENQAFIFLKLNNLEKAQEKYREQEKLCRDSGFKLGLANCIFNQSVVYCLWNKYEIALGLLIEHDVICKQFEFGLQLIKSFFKQIDILYHLGREEDTFVVFQKLEKLCSELDNNEELHNIMLENLDRMYELKLFDKADSLLNLLESLCKKSNNTDGIIECLILKSDIFYQNKEYYKSLEIDQEIENLYKSIGDNFGLQISYKKQAENYISLKQFEEALTYLKKQEEILRTNDDIENLIENLKDQAFVYEKANDFSSAKRIRENARTIATEYYTAINNKQNE